MSNGGGGKITPTCVLSYVAPMIEIPPVEAPTYVLEVKLFNGANSYVAGSWYVTGNRYGVWQTGNNNVSRDKTARQIFLTSFSTLSIVHYKTIPSYPRQLCLILPKFKMADRNRK